MGNRSKYGYPFVRSEPDAGPAPTRRNARRLERKAQRQKISEAAMLAIAESIIERKRAAIIEKARPFRLLDPRTWFRRRAF